MDSSDLVMLAGVSVVLPLTGHLLADRFALKLRKEYPLQRATDPTQRKQEARIVAQAVNGAPLTSDGVAVLLERFQDRSNQRESALSKEINASFKLRACYQWVFLGSVVLGLIPILIGIWLIVLGSLPGGTLAAAIGALSQVSGIIANQAAKVVGTTSEARMKELRDSHSANESFERALGAIALIQAPMVRENALRDLALSQVGIIPTSLRTS